ncbi:hypothetical protein F511_32634 [Dorcoceras hygrometricum]|uniref:Uncharacterized protein n=1 Tax=Dorcoceras hygrometricum TaxID=472368 RepID=A0A2Z7C4R1_9LAMI|nr:hypothetical protein F511_32634 [Dorcoceras hygrometricum]
MTSAISADNYLGSAMMTSAVMSSQSAVDKKRKSWISDYDVISDVITISTSQRSSPLPSILGPRVGIPEPLPSLFGSRLQRTSLELGPHPARASAASSPHPFPSAAPRRTPLTCHGGSVIIHRTTGQDDLIMCSGQAV